MIYQRIQTSIEFIEANLLRDFKLEEVSNASGFSLSHFYKLFLASTGFSIKEFIRRKRLASAACQLVKTNRRIIDIAVEVGFNSQEVFTRAFSDVYGTTPAKYRVNRKELLVFESYDSFSHWIEKREQRTANEAKVSTKIIEKGEMYLVGMELYTSVIETIDHNEIPLFWQNTFLPRKHEIKNVTNPNIYVDYDIHNPITDTLYHITGFEVNIPATPKGMVLRTLPKLTYAVFSPDRPLDLVEYSSLVRYVYGEWLPMAGYQLADDFTFDARYYNENLEVTKLELYIPVK